MNDRAKLIWDFRGPAAKQTAAHHLIHLNEYFEQSEIELYEAATQQQSEMWHSAYVIVDLEAVDKLRAALKPHRGQRVKTIT